MSITTANTSPIWIAKGDVSTNNGTLMAQAITLAANDYTGAGANNVLVFTASGDGAYLRGLKFTAAGSNVQTVARVFINNGAINTTASNNSFLDEITLPLTTASTISALPAPIMMFNGALGMFLPPNFRLYAGLATAVSAGYFVTPIFGGQL